MREEVEKSEPKDADGACEKKDADEPNSFMADTSNLDSTESEAPPVAKKRKRRIPPPNPPYRTRNKGRYSMLRGLFKNTQETPVVIEEDPVDIEENGRNGEPTKEVDGKEAEKREAENVEAEKGECEKKEATEEEAEIVEEVEAEENEATEEEAEIVEEVEAEENEATEEEVDEKDNEYEGDSDSSEGMFDSEDERMAISSCDEEEADNQDKEMEEVLGFVGEEEQLDERNKRKEKVVESQGSQTTHQMDNTSNPTVNSSITGTTHGGTARPFKPPAKVGPLGVEASYVGKKKTFTSLRNLQKAAVIRKYSVGKKA
ncbi:hypothetical protein ACET3Z_031041 [Daucus carota]